MGIYTFMQGAPDDLPARQWVLTDESHAPNMFDVSFYLFLVSRKWCQASDMSRNVEVIGAAWLSCMHAAFDGVSCLCWNRRLRTSDMNKRCIWLDWGIDWYGVSFQHTCCFPWFPVRQPDWDCWQLQCELACGHVYNEEANNAIVMRDQEWLARRGIPACDLLSMAFGEMSTSGDILVDSNRNIGWSRQELLARKITLSWMVWFDVARFPSLFVKLPQ